MAKIYGQVLAEMGLLSDGSVEVVGASKLIGDVVGATQTAVNELLDNAKVRLPFASKTDTQQSTPCSRMTAGKGLGD